MQVVGLFLILLTIGATVGPVGAVVVIYRDNLPALLIPPEVQEIMSGDSTLLAPNIGSNQELQNGVADLGPMGFVMPTFVSATVDAPTKTFSVTVNVTNFLNYDVTLNTINATVQNSQDGNQLASIHLSNSPIVILAGQSAFVTVSGFWSQAAEDFYFNHPDATSINVRITNAVVDVNGIILQTSRPIDVGAIPLLIEGLQ